VKTNCSSSRFHDEFLAVFVKGDAFTEDWNGTPVTSTVSTKFMTQTRLLLHELTHTRQYQGLGFSYTRFGWSYLNAWCKAGFSYKDNAYEVEARSHEADADNLLQVSGTGRPFFKRWRSRADLQAALGYPVSTYTGSFSWAGQPVSQTLVFQRGMLEMRLFPSPGVNACHRVWISGEYSVLVAGVTCQIPTRPRRKIPCLDSTGPQAPPELMRRLPKCNPDSPDDPEWDPQTAAHLCDAPRNSLTALAASKPWDCSGL
jgi:hypothetical protein